MLTWFVVYFHSMSCIVNLSFLFRCCIVFHVTMFLFLQIVGVEEDNLIIFHEKIR